MMELETLEPLTDAWWQQQAGIVGATQRQAAFARTMIENPGAKFNKIAELSGIQGTSRYLATAGSDLAKHPKVKRLYDLALLVKSDEEVEIAYPPELLRHLSEIARNDTSTTNRLKANDLLLKYHAQFQGENKEHNDKDLLDKLCDMGHPVFVILAMHYAHQMAVEWTPPGKALARIRDVTVYQAIVAELGLSRHVLTPGTMN